MDSGDVQLARASPQQQGAQNVPWFFLPAVDTRLLATLCCLHSCVGETPTGQLPVLHLDGQPHVEHLAIARLLAKRAGWHGRDERIDYLADSLADAVSTGFRWGVLPAVCTTCKQGPCDYRRVGCSGSAFKDLSTCAPPVLLKAQLMSYVVQIQILCLDLDSLMSTGQ